MTILNELRNHEVESSYFFTLNKNLKVIEHKLLTSDNVDSVTIDMHTLVKLIKPSVRFIILIHNHPSQTVFPSKADYETTQKLLNLGELLNFKVLDHIIVTSKEYFSFAEAGILEGIKNRCV